MAPEGYIEINHSKNKNIFKAYYISFNSSQKLLLEPLIGKFITGYLIDQKKGVWISTNKNGLYHFENLQLRQVSIKENITHIFETNNQQVAIHIGAGNKVVDYISISKQGQIKRVNTINTIDSISTNNQSVRFTSNGDVFYKEGFLSFRSLQIKKDIIYTCSHNSVRKYKFDLKMKYDSLLVVGSETIMSFFVDNESSIWAGGLNGLYYYDGNKTQLYTFKNGTINDRVEDIKQDEVTQNLFIGTIGNGLYIIRNDSIVGHFNEANSPLGNNNINQLYLEGDSMLWIGTTKGLNALNLKTFPYQLTAPCILGESVSKKFIKLFQTNITFIF